jgi:tRNA threonylcarbamoyladenosine biosynthesis protein TsaE
MEKITKNAKETKKLGEILAEKILSLKIKKRFLALKGELGGGKTTFLQGFARGLGIKKKISSPTFIIMKKFKIKNPKSKFENFYHIDCYRIQRPKEILNLGFKEIVKNSKNIVAVEWAEKIERVLPKNCLKIEFEMISFNKRKIKFNENINCLLLKN